METDLTIHKITGDIQFDSLLKSLRLLQDSVTKYVLWDLREVYNISGTSPEKIEASSAHIEEMPISPGGKAAFVFASETDYGIGRMFETYAKMKDLSFEIAMFKSMDSAKTWLDEK